MTSGLSIYRPILAAPVPEQYAGHDGVLRPHRAVARSAAVGQELELRDHVNQTARKQMVPVTSTVPTGTIAPTSVRNSARCAAASRKAITQATLTASAHVTSWATEQTSGGRSIR